MEIEFFNSGAGNTISPDSYLPGVYKISICRKDDRSRAFTLYIGESYCMLHRCARHVYRTYDDPAYLGLTRAQFDDGRLCMRIEVYKSVNKEWSDYKARDVELKEYEIAAIEELHPVSQCPHSDRVKKNAAAAVTEAIEELLK